MISNNVHPITMKEDTLVFNFHPQFRQLSSQTLGYFYESGQKVKINPLIACVLLPIESREVDRQVRRCDSLFITPTSKKPTNL